MIPDKIDQIKAIFDYFAYHNKNLTKKQWFMIEDLRLLVDDLKQEAEEGKGSVNMGAVNYGMSDYITLGYNLDWDSSDFESWEALNASVKEMREEVKHTPTWRQYERGA